MEYFILPKNIPVIKFAHSYSSNSYNIHHETPPHLLEITYIERGNCMKRLDNGTIINLPQESIVTHTFQTPCTTFANEPHRHCTIGIDLEYEFVDKNTPGAIPLDDVITSEKFVSKTAKLLHACVNDFILDRENTFRGTSHIFKLFAQYDDYYKEKMLYLNNPNIQPSLTQYVKKIKDYVMHHIREKITIEDVANYVNLSCGYTSNIFKQVCGITIIRYVNEMKLQLIQDLTLNTSSTLSQACEMVGIDDPYYASRMFRKYFGTTLHNIKASKR